MSNELAAFLPSHPGFTLTPGRRPVWPLHSGCWPLSICGTVVSFGTEIWVRIQSRRGAVLSRSDLEKVVHSKFHLTRREAGRQAGWQAGSKESENGGRCFSEARRGEYSFLNNVKWLEAVIFPWILHFCNLCCGYCVAGLKEGRKGALQKAVFVWTTLGFLPHTHTHSHRVTNTSGSWFETLRSGQHTPKAI